MHKDPHKPLNLADAGGGEAAITLANNSMEANTRVFNNSENHPVTPLKASTVELQLYRVASRWHTTSTH